MERAIRAQQELGLLQPEIKLCLPILLNGTCIELWIGSSHHQVLSGTAPGEQLKLAIGRYWDQQVLSGTALGKQPELAVERYWDQQRAKLMLRDYMTTLVKAAPRIVIKLSRLQ